MLLNLMMMVVVAVMAAGKKWAIDSMCFGFWFLQLKGVFLGENKPPISLPAYFTVVFFLPSTPHPHYSHSLV